MAAKRIPERVASRHEARSTARSLGPPGKSDGRGAGGPIYVTRPLLPPLEEFLPYLEEIWESGWLTNAGPFHQKLEKALAEHLGVRHLSLFSNGTIALVTALQCLRITGQVITTPYSFVATSHALLWNGIEPVFVDIEAATCNLDPKRIEAAITPRTTAILPVHCYGNPCDVDGIQTIADRYGLKVIYDAAHAFGVTHKGTSLLNFGDLSVLSFHATKAFNTFEGGAIVCPDARTKQRIDYLKNFGFADEVTVVAPGINGKMNEIQAAFGLLQLRHIDASIRRRRDLDERYRALLRDVGGIRCLPLPADSGHNYSYFPVLVEAEYPLTRDELYHLMKQVGVFARRYFFPLISDFPMYRGLPSAGPDLLPTAQSISSRILCLPIYPTLPLHEVDRVVDVIKGARISGLLTGGTARVTAPSAE
jgi:dTDP-4-amino-4,6-dideoxygalactose transaminase